MKKFRLILLAFVTILFPVTMVSCGDDDEPVVPEEPTKEDPVPVSIKISETFSPSNDVLDLYDVTLTYFDGKENKVVELDGKKTIEVTASLPTTYGVMVALKLHDGVTEETLTKEQYDLTVSFNSPCLKYYDEKGNEIEALTKNFDSLTPVGFPQGGPSTVFKLDGIKMIHLAWKYAKDGSFTSIDDYWDNY